MSTCARCGHELGVGRFCTNCGHPIGEPVPESEVLPRLDDAPLPTREDDRPTWLLPVVGAVLALLLVAALLAWLGREDDPGTSEGRATDPAPSALARLGSGSSTATAGPRRGPAARRTTVSVHGLCHLPSDHLTSERITRARPTASGATSHTRLLVPSCAQYSPVIELS